MGHSGLGPALVFLGFCCIRVTTWQCEYGIFKLFKTGVYVLVSLLSDFFIVCFHFFIDSLIYLFSAMNRFAFMASHIQHYRLYELSGQIITLHTTIWITHDHKMIPFPWEHALGNLKLQYAANVAPLLVLRTNKSGKSLLTNTNHLPLSSSHGAVTRQSIWLCLDWELGGPGALNGVGIGTRIHRGKATRKQGANTAPGAEGGQSVTRDRSTMVIYSGANQGWWRNSERGHRFTIPSLEVQRLYIDII